MSDPRTQNQGDLFRGPSLPKESSHAPYQKASATSRDAALRIIPKAEGLRYEVLSVIRDAGEAGATRKEIEAQTGIQTQTVCPRIVELKEAGLIRPLTYFDAESRKIVTVKRENCEVLIAVEAPSAA